MMQRIVLIACCFLLVTPTVRPAVALVSTNVPLDHWSYNAVEKLANYGFIDSSMLTIKPLSRIEMARHIGRAMYTLEHTKGSPEILESILERLKKEFREELIFIGILDAPYSDSSLKPIEDPYVGYLYAQDGPDLENRRGDVFRQGSNYRAGFASRARLLDTAAFYLHPEYVDSTQNDGNVDLIEAYGKVMVGSLEIEAGKDSLWWGPGHHGSIIMSNNAQPFTLLKVTNPQPLQLPWIFRYVGPFKGQWFLAQLEEDRDIPEAKLTGLRLNIKPLPTFELGVSRVIMFGGQGAPGVDLFDYVMMFLTRSEQGENNQLAGVDASFLMPLWENKLLRSVRIYADLAGEDEAAGWPSKWGELLGLQLNDVLKTGRTDLRIEYANNMISGLADVFYEHSLYTSGYTYKGRVIGHHMGTDSKDLFLQLSHYPTQDMMVELACDRQTHRLSADRQPTLDVFECNLTLFPSDDWRVRAGYRYENWDNRGDDDNHILQLVLIRRF